MESIVRFDNFIVEETLLKTAGDEDVSDDSRNMNLTSPVAFLASGSQQPIGMVKNSVSDEKKMICIDESMSENFTDSPSIMEATKLENGVETHIFPQVSSTPLRSSRCLNDTSMHHQMINSENEAPNLPLVNSVHNNSREVSVFDTSSKYNLSDFWESMSEEKPVSCEALDALTVVDSMVNYSVISCDNVTLLFDALEVPLMSTSKQLPPNTPHDKVIPGMNEFNGQLNLHSELFANETSFDHHFISSQSDSKLSELKTRSDFYTLAFINSFNENDNFSNACVPPKCSEMYILPQKDLLKELSFEKEYFKESNTTCKESYLYLQSKGCDTNSVSQVETFSSPNIKRDGYRDDSVLSKCDTSLNFSFISPVKGFISKLNDEDSTVFSQNNVKSNCEGSFNRLPVFTAITEEFKVSSDKKEAENCSKNYKVIDIADLSVSLTYSDSTFGSRTVLDDENVSGLMLEYDSKFPFSNVSTDFKHEHSPEKCEPTNVTRSDQNLNSILIDEECVSQSPVKVLHRPHSPPSMVVKNEISIQKCKEQLGLYEEFSVSCQSTLSGMKQDIYALQDNIVTLSEKNNALSNQINLLEENNESLKAERDDLLKQYETIIIEKEKQESLWNEKYESLCSQNDAQKEIYVRMLSENELTVSALRDEIASLHSKIKEGDNIHQRFKEVSEELTQLNYSYFLVKNAHDQLTDENTKLMAFKSEVEKLLNSSAPDGRNSSSGNELNGSIDLIQEISILKAKSVDNGMFLTDIGKMNQEMISVFSHFIEELNKILSLPCDSDSVNSEFSVILGSILDLLKSLNKLKLEDLFDKLKQSKFMLNTDITMIDSKDNFNISSVCNSIKNKLSDLEMMRNSFDELKINYNSIIEKLMTCFGVKNVSVHEILQCIESFMDELNLCKRELDVEKEKNRSYYNLKTESVSMVNKINELELANSQLSVDLDGKINDYEKLSSELIHVKIQSEELNKLNEEWAKKVSSHHYEIESLKKLIEYLKEESQKSMSKIFSITKEPCQSFEDAIKILRQKLSSHQDLHEKHEWAKSKLQDLDNECEELTSKNRDLEQRLHEATNAESSEETRIRDELAKEKEINSDLCRENFRLKVSLKDMADKNKELQESLLDLNKRILSNHNMQDDGCGAIEELKAEIIDKNSTITLMKVKLMRLEEDYEHRGQTVQNYRRKVSELKIELENMENRLEQADAARMKEQLTRQSIIPVETPAVKPQTVDASVQVDNQSTTALPSNFVHACKVMDLTRKVEKLKMVNSSLKKALMKKEGQKTLRSVFQDMTNN